MGAEIGRQPVGGTVRGLVTRRLRFVTVALLVSVLVLALGLWFRSGVGTISPTSDMSVHELPRLGIEFEYPSNWHLQEFSEDLGLSSMTGALVSNLVHEFDHPDLGRGAATSAWDMRGLPDGLIVVSFEQLDRHNFKAKRTKGLPLDLDDAVVSREAEHGVDTYGAPQPRFFLPFSVEGHLASGAQVFIGAVDADEREAIDAILASVRPLKTQKGGWAERFSHVR